METTNLINRSSAFLQPTSIVLFYQIQKIRNRVATITTR